jgi:transposase-like protein
MVNRRRAFQRYRCQNPDCPYQTFILNPTYPGRTRLVKQQIVEMTLNGSGIRDIARVLHVSTATVIQELKKNSTTAKCQSDSLNSASSRTSRGGHSPSRRAS